MTSQSGCAPKGFDLVRGIRDVLVLELTFQGAPEPEDGAHDILLRAFVSGNLNHGRSYWVVSARNMARDQRRRRHELICGGSDMVTPLWFSGDSDPVPDCSFIQGLSASELSWLLAYYDSKRHSGADRVRATRLRKIARGESPPSRDRSVCPRGHAATPANQYVCPKTGKRSCTKCRRSANSAWISRSRESIHA